MTFTLRPSTIKIQQGLMNSYRRNPNMALLTVKTGGGKTYGAIHTFGSMYKNAVLLVFTTSKVAKSKQWEQSVKDYNQVMGTDLKIICYNYDKLVSQKFLNELFARLKTVLQYPIVLILDEVHRIKLASSGKLSKRATILTKIARQDFIKTTLGLSATAFSNSYLDVATYLIIAGYYRSKSEYMHKHVKRFNEYWAPIVTDRFGNISRDAFKNPDQIDREIAQITTYVDTSNYMPQLTGVHQYFELNKEDKHLYNRIAIAYAQGQFEFPMQARMSQEHLLSNRLARQKDEYLLHILHMREKGAFERKTPILIFYQYTTCFKHLKGLLHNMYPDYDIKAINGSAHLDASDLSKPDNDNSIYLIQYEAGGEGLDWQWSNLSIFYEAPVRYEKFEQAKGRNLRNKSIMPHVYHYYLEYVKTLDGERWDVNRSKRDFTETVAENTFLQNLPKKK